MEIKEKVRIPGLDTSIKTLAIIDRKDANEIGVNPLDRIIVSHGKKKITCVVDVDDGTLVKSGEMVISNEVVRILGVKNRDVVSIKRRGDLVSKHYIRKKIDGKRLSYKEYYEIVKDIVSRNLNDLELTSFVISLYIRGMSVQEAADLSMAMVNVGDKLSFGKKTVVDKHSIGGIPGDKTTILVVPIMTSLGYTMPKTSSRAITDPAGSADREEVMFNVSLGLKDIKKIVNKVGGCMVWGGSLSMSPADDLIINIERPLRIDSVLLPSILSKKKAAGSKYVVIDMPTGPEAKVKTVRDAEHLFSQFKKIGKKMGMEIVGASTFASQPLGRAVGPALEAREALENLMNPSQKDLIEKATGLCGLLISKVENISFKKARNIAMHALTSGKAYKKFVEIAKAQGAKVLDPQKIKIGKYSFDVKANKSGYVSYISNRDIVTIAKLAGAPFDKGAGILLHKKLGEKVKRGDVLMTIYSNSEEKLGEALKYRAFKITSAKVSVPKDVLLKRFR